MSKLINMTDINGVKLNTSGKYCDDDIQVQIDDKTKANIVSENIKQGVTILGVEGSVVASDGIDYIKAWAGGDTNLGNPIDLYSESVVEIGDNSFQYNMNIKSVDFPNVTALPTYAFYMCNNLETVNIPNVTLFPSNVFGKCNKLVSVNIPNATSFGTYAFHECYLLTNINSTENIVSIGDNCFAYCKAIEKIDFPNVETVGTYAFQACDILTEIKLGNITTINSGTFRNSKKLYDIYLGYEGLVSLSFTSAFTNTGNTRGYVNIHVRPGLDLATQYASATNWSSLITAGTIIIVEDYTDD